MQNINVKCNVIITGCRNIMTNRTNVLLCHTVPQKFVLSLSGTVLTASWDPPATQSVSYTLICSVAGREVLLLNTTLTEVVVGIYKTETDYSCNVYATVFGIDQPATDDQYIKTGGNYYKNT